MFPMREMQSPKCLWQRWFRGWYGCSWHGTASCLFVSTQFHSILFPALFCAPGGWLPWTASSRLPCSLASNWVCPGNTAGLSEGRRRKELVSLSPSPLLPCLLAGIVGDPSSLTQRSLSVGHSSLLLPFQAWGGDGFPWALPCLFLTLPTFLHPVSLLNSLQLNSFECAICCSLGHLLTSMMKADKSLPSWGLHSGKQWHKRNRHEYHEQRKARWGDQEWLGKAPWGNDIWTKT